jgi:flagella basal body P-ring formation protein FlgA
LKKAMITQRGLKIAKKLRVRRGVQNVDELKLRRLMRAALTRQLAPGIRFDDMILRGGVAMPRGRLRVELEMPRKVRMGLNNFKANIYAGNSKPKTTIVRVELRSDAAMSHQMIARGDPVWLRVKAGAVVVSTRGVAQQDGRTGQRIAVMPRQGRKVVYGTVTESGVVEMEL